MAFARYYPITCNECGSIISRKTAAYERILSEPPELTFTEAVSRSTSYSEAFEKVWGSNFPLGLYLGSGLDRGIPFEEVLQMALENGIPYAKELNNALINGLTLDESIARIGKISIALDKVGAKRTCCRTSFMNPTMIPWGQSSENITPVLRTGSRLEDLTRQMENLSVKSDNKIPSQGVLDAMRTGQPRTVQQPQHSSLTNSAISLRQNPENVITSQVQAGLSVGQPRKVIRKYYISEKPFKESEVPGKLPYIPPEQRIRWEN